MQGQAKGKLMSGSRGGLLGLSPAGVSEKLCGTHLTIGLIPHLERRKNGGIYHELLSSIG